MQSTYAAQMAVIFILIALGYIANKRRLLDANFCQRLSDLVIRVACPCLILSSVMVGVAPRMELVPQLLFVGFLTHALLAGLGVALPRLFCRDASSDKGIYGFMIAFGNIGFIGYPVVASLFGTHAIFYASVLMLPYTVFAFTVGFWFISGDRRCIQLSRSVLLSPMMVASLWAILIVCAGTRNFPAVVRSSVKVVGDITVPCALLVIGSSLADVPFAQLWRKPSLFAVSVLRLVIVPLGIYALTNCIGLDATTNSVNTVLTAMPVSTYGTMFCYKFHRNEALMTEGTCLSTLLSAISVPLLVNLINH